jgi:hypothetical protein
LFGVVAELLSCCFSNFFSFTDLWPGVVIISSQKQTANHNQECYCCYMHYYYYVDNSTMHYLC